ncbi:hypothetical protein GCM10022243_59990 [Saccharothrix violaceirubra]|uniref:Uncharacterized protein YukE n=1 Tax=Saccharothrix violaceirubra TaxID=413306 RepID=A0A7W7T7K7_9PSEU|nr:type VII secretion target [Saccharothrix violaceirubra]MBB4967975.1 uncharacterized protein YukE [Saccharothrix violaceirubra]
MSEGYEVLVEELRGHADRLRGIKDTLDQALDAAGQVGLSGAAYGKICMMLPPMMTLIGSAGVSSIAECANAVDATVTGVRVTATDYEGVEQANRAVFRGGAE